MWVLYNKEMRSKGCWFDRLSEIWYKSKNRKTGAGENEIDYSGKAGARKGYRWGNSGPGHTDNAVIYKGDNAIAWAYGHLLTMKDPEDYNPALKNWSLDTLPIYFQDWGHKPDAQSVGRGRGKPQRLAQIGELLKNSACVIHAGDPDYEESIWSTRIWDGTDIRALRAHF